MSFVQKPSAFTACVTFARLALAYTIYAMIFATAVIYPDLILDNSILLS